ncbi:hypothetical protein LOD99_10530 [Oopsacas minuta]|uniref:Uncharacterized protein n=1 Tax=Oopsacas minuta TaxID=111878 RepID=A0AAV7KGA1_9METZ|nr:hypothetical protein LOD99_10530 [Oopsacas minuta]
MVDGEMLKLAAGIELYEAHSSESMALPTPDKYIESDHPPIYPSSSPTLSPPRFNIINLTLSESRPMDEDATSEKSEHYSHSKTIDTISETTSCTASVLRDKWEDDHSQYTYVSQ